MKAQRLRVRYRVLGEAASLTHRELMGLLEQAARGAGLVLAYSEARRRAPQISVAAPLPVGVTSDCELADLFLAERVEPLDAAARLAGALPPGIEPIAAWEVGLAAPSLQSQVRWAEYEAEAPPEGLRLNEVRKRIEALLAVETFPWEHRRQTKVRRYDLRPLVLGLRAQQKGGGLFLFTLRLRAGQEMTARADQVVAALGLSAPLRIHRCRLYVEETQPAVAAYRRVGEPD